MAGERLGQHWLLDDFYLDAIIKTAGLRANDFVLEVGPGKGSLTKKLLSAGAKVTAVELDDNLYKELLGLQTDRLKIVHGDILEFDLTTLPKDYKVVANIPYYLTGKLLRKLTDSSNPPLAVTLLVQKEVAERLAAEPGELSLIAVAVQLFGQVTLGDIVPAAAFKPPPKVDSRIVTITRHPKPLFTDLDSKSFWRLAKAGFAEKRKKLRSSLAGGLNISKVQAEELLEKAGINPHARAQELSLEDWHAVAKIWQA